MTLIGESMARTILELTDLRRYSAATYGRQVPLVDQETGEVLDRPLVGSLDLLERSPEGRLVLVDIKTAARKYTPPGRGLAPALDL